MCKSEKRSTSVHAIAEGEESDSDSDEYTVYVVLKMNTSNDAC